MPGKLLPTAFDRIKHAIGCRRVLLGNAEPDCDKVLVGPIGTDDFQHDQPVRGVASNRRRASTFTSAMVARVLVGLSSPS